MTLNIIGGVYYEICREPFWQELYGSGLRAAHALNNRNTPIIFTTAIGKDDYERLAFIATALGITLNATVQPVTSVFEYDYPLSSPLFNTDIEQLSKKELIEDDYFIQYGMLEGGFQIKAKCVIYDPQSPGNPRSFWENGSVTQDLIWVSNLQEAINFTGATEIGDIKERLFTKERVKAAIIKNGTNGATLIQKNCDDYSIPAFKSESVWPIGTGDIFTAILGHDYLIKKISLEESALNASLSTAYYSQNICLPIPQVIDRSKFAQFLKTTTGVKSVYLAGPFFNISQRWIIDQFKNQLTQFGLKVFSPYHEIGLGEAEVVVPKDIIEIRKSDLIFAIVDGLDPGTLFEIGFAKALNKPVIIFVENEKDEALTMLKGTDCIITNDFSTAIYKCIWEAYK